MWGIIKNEKQHLLEESIKHVYELPHLRVEAVEPEMPLIAVEFIKKYGLKPRDAMHCAFMKFHDIREIASDDKDFDKVSWIKRLPL